MIYLLIMIVVAVAGITRLWLQQRREHKKHVLEDYRGSLERLAMVPLAQQMAIEPPKPTVAGRLRRRMDERREERRADRDAAAEDFDWEIDLTGDEPAARPIPSSSSPPPRGRVRDERWVTLNGRRLWRRPREPWLWTYEKPARPARAEAGVAAPAPELARFDARGRLAVEGNLARSDRVPGRHSTHMPVFAPPRGRGRDGSLDPQRREAAKLRLEARRRTGARLS